MCRRHHVFIPTLVILLAGCTDKPSTINVTQLERGGDVETICLCRRDDGTVQGAPHSQCDPEDGDEDCAPYALLLQKNRGEIAVVDIMHRYLHDSDQRAPFVTFPQVGEFPSDMAVSEDGQRVWVVHMGEPTLAEVETADLLGPTLPETTFHTLPGRAGALTLAPDEATAFVTLPDMGALAVVDLTAEPPAVATYALSSEPLPEPALDAESGDASDDILDADDATDAPADIPPEVAADIPGEEGTVAPPVGFTPLRLEYVPVEGEGDGLLVCGFDDAGGGGVLVLDVAALMDGTADAILAHHLRDTPISEIDVAHVDPVEGAGNGAPEGLYLYAADRDEPLLHVVDLQTGLELDTSGGNPLVRGGAIRTDGLVQDLLVVEFDEEEAIPSEFAPEDLDPLDWYGVYIFAATSAGVVHAIDVYDRYCWYLVDGGTDLECTPHVMRNALPTTDSQPFWLEPPVVFSGEEALTSLEYCSALYPCFESFEDTNADERTYGITFYPRLPGDEETQAQIRRPLSETWTLVWEGKIQWSGGIGGNLSEDGTTLTDPAMPFCAIGIRGEGDGYPGDVLVIEDGPMPLDEDTDCSSWPEDGSMAYRIVRATQSELTLEPVSQWSPESESALWLGVGTDAPPFPLPTEECFPFAVKYHIRTDRTWTVTGSRTGFLHSTALDEEGRCVDAFPPCESWARYDETGDCTLRRGRARMNEAFVNPYVRFVIDPQTLNWGASGGQPDAIMKPGLGFSLLASSGFEPLSEWVSALPESMVYLDHTDLFYISDRGYDGLVELDPDSFSVLYSYD